MMENDLYTLCDFPKTMSIWSYFQSYYLTDFSITTCQIWFKHHALSKTRSLFLVICWEIWRNINDEIFQNNKKDNWASVNSIFSYHSSMIKALARDENCLVLR